jgi:hypothetical protein
VVEYHRDGLNGVPQIDVTIRPPAGEPPEFFPDLDPSTFHERVNERSVYVRLEPSTPVEATPASPDRRGPDRVRSDQGPLRGPRHLQWSAILAGGDAPAPTLEEYLAAIVASGLERRRVLSDEPEIALIAAPDLYEDLENEGEQDAVWGALLREAERSHDRLVLIDLPPDPSGDRDLPLAVKRLGALRGAIDEGTARAGAVYHPRVRVPDPLGGVAEPLKTIPPSGHVAGVISRLDRERGAHHTPANAGLYDAVDVTRGFTDRERMWLNAEGINPVRCIPGRGLQIWGGRTLEQHEPFRFLAHRRLIHRLVRTIRRVVEPLVFEVNGPELWLAFTRAVTAVLLAAFRAGALKGARPEEAFRVQCDQKNNPPEARDAGQCLCFIEIAPAAPMEFVLLRVALSTDGSLEVME